MISTLRGRIFSKKPDSLVIDVNGVGYQVFTPLTSFSSLPEEGAEIFLYTYTHLKEDAIQLYGFLDEGTKRSFISLITVNGIGPKMALNILSGISVQDFHHAIETENVTALCGVPGLGKKTAQRLILELKEKLPSSHQTRKPIYEDAMSALINLGYKRATAEKHIQAALKSGHDDIESLLREALKLLNEGK